MNTQSNTPLSDGLVLPPAPSPKAVPVVSKDKPVELNQAGMRIAKKKAEKAALANHPKVKAMKTAPKKAVTKAAGTVKVPTAPKGKKSVAKPEQKGLNAKPAATICSVCHKPLTRPESIAAGMGDVCEGQHKLLPAGVTMEQHYQAIRVGSIPEGFIPLNQAMDKANEKGISRYRMLQVCGGERALRKPFSHVFQVKFYKGQRFVSKDALKHLEDIRKIGPEPKTKAAKPKVKVTKVAKKAKKASKK